MIITGARVVARRCQHTAIARVSFAGRYVSNLSTGCLRCLCHASTACNATIGCSRGYCGPYYLYREYWKDAGQVVLPDDDPDRDQAFVDCAADSACAQKAVENYMAKYGRVSSRTVARAAVVREKLLRKQQRQQ